MMKRAASRYHIDDPEEIFLQRIKSMVEQGFFFVQRKRRSMIALVYT